MEKKLGKIESVHFGIGGYQDSMIGLHITLGGNSWGVYDSKSAWDAELVKWSEYCKLNESDRDLDYAGIIRFVSKMLNEAKVKTVDKLKGIPIEATFDGNILKEWRILTEVL